jgi:putative SOS response-associated peptidase YedK
LTGHCQTIRQTVRHLDVDRLTAYPVARRVGNPANDDAALIEAEGDSLDGSA